MVSVIDNRPPVCADSAATTAEDVAVSIPLQASDPDGDALTYLIVSGPSNGTANLSGNTVTYQGAANYHGPDSFTFMVRDPSGAESGVCTVTITVTPVNDAPTCADGSLTVDENATGTVTLSGSDVDGDALIYVIVSGPSNGTVSLSGNVASYSGNANYHGPDSFTFRVRDPSGAESGVCTVSVTVTPVNGGPIVVIEVSPLRDLGATVPGLTMISANNANVCATLDGTGTWDAEGDAIVSYTWLVDGVEVGTGPVIDVCLLVGARTVTLLADDGQNVGEGSVIVDVLSGGEAVEELVLVVDASVIERKNKRPFIATLKTAAAAFDRGSNGSALNRLNNAFQNKVRAQVGKANPDVADEWIAIAQEIIDAYESAPSDCEACE
jgi:hypothetical protein